MTVTKAFSLHTTRLGLGAFCALTLSVLTALGAATFAPAARAESTTLRIGYATTRDSHYGVGADAFCKGIEEGTSGRYRCQHFPSSALGGEREMIEAVQLGTLDLVNTSTGPLGNFVPASRLFDIPFLFRDYAHARTVLDGETGQKILAGMQKSGLIGVAWTENGFRHMTNNRRPIHTAADAAGLKLRTMENRIHMDGYKTFGLLPTPMPFPELFTALQQGTVDGQENPIPVILASKFSQVQKYLSLTGHVYSPAVILMSPASWGKLSAEDQAAFRKAGAAARDAQRAKVNADEQTGIAALKKDGMTVDEQVDAASFRKAIAPAYQGYAREFGAETIQAIQAVR